MASIPFMVNSGNLETLAEQSPNFDKTQTKMFFDSVENLSTHLKADVLNDELALNIGINLSKQDYDSENTRLTAKYLISAGMPLSEVAELAIPKFEAYTSKENASEAMSGLIYASRLMPSWVGISDELQDAQLNSVTQMCEVARKAIHYSDIETAYLALSIIDNFSDITEKNDTLSEKIEGLHSKLHIRFYQESSSFLGNEVLDCYNNIIDSVAEENKIANEQSFEEFDKMGNKIREHYMNKYGEAQFYDSRVQKVMNAELDLETLKLKLESKLKRDEKLVEKDKQYQSFVLSGLSKEFQADLLYDHFGDYKFEHDKMNLTRILMNARQILSDQKPEFDISNFGIEY